MYEKILQIYCICIHTLIMLIRKKNLKKKSYSYHNKCMLSMSSPRTKKKKKKRSSREQKKRDRDNLFMIIGCMISYILVKVNTKHRTIGHFQCLNLGWGTRTYYHITSIAILNSPVKACWTNFASRSPPGSRIQSKTAS